MKHYKLAFLGFGNVGKSLARLLQFKRIELAENYNLAFSVTGIATARHGLAVDPDGIDLDRAISLVENGDNLEAVSTVSSLRDSVEFIKTCQANVLFENTPVNYQNGQPAIDFIRLGLESGMHVITANKGPVVHGYRELTRLANSRGRKFFFESTVMDGAPIFSLFRETLPAARLKSFRGVLNSTTNMILTRMEQGESFEAAVAYCQKIGIAETDPSGDIDGWDAAVKVAALVTVLMDIPVKPADINRQGIREITPEQIVQAKGQGKRWKLICVAEKNLDQVNVFVRPVLVDRDSPLFSAEGTTSVVQFETDVLGRLTVVEENPGPDTTAYGCLSDFLNAVKG
jgi:homoserine dehydrogenase